MKVIIVLLKVMGIFLALAALGAFASDLLPVEGFPIGSWDSSNGDTHFFKIVPSNEPKYAGWYGVAFILLSAICFFIARTLKKNAR